MPSQFAAIVRVNVATGDPELLVKLTHEEDERQKLFRSVSFTLDRDGEELYFANDAEGKANEVVWYRPNTHEHRGRTHPIDASIRVGGLTLAPAGKPLALRFGPPGPSAPIAYWFYEERIFTPIVPDDSTRVEWLTLLIGSARQLLRTSLPPSDGPTESRASILPARGGVATNRDPLGALRQIGRVGRPLCDRPIDAPPADRALVAFLNEARFFFDYLRGDDHAAVQSLDELDKSANSPDHRMRLLCLRGQLFLGLGELDRAKDVVAFVKAAASRGRSRIEITPAGPSMTNEPKPVERWATELAQSIVNVERLRLKPGGRDDALLDHPNPDAPPPPGHLIPAGREDDPGVFAPLIPRDRFGRGVPGVDELTPPARPPGPPLMPRFPKDGPPF